MSHCSEPSAGPVRSGSDGFRECPKGPRADGRQWHGRSQHRDRMLESADTDPRFPTWAGCRRVRPRDGRGRAEALRRSRTARARCASRRYSIRRRCGVSRVIPQEAVHFACGTFAALGAAADWEPARESHVPGWRRPREPLRQECQQRVLSLGQAKQQGGVAESVRPFSFRES